MSRRQEKGTTTMKRTGLLAALAISASLALAPSAVAAFGDNAAWGEINDGAGPLQEVPAFPNLNPDPEPDKAFWAGTCDLSSALAEEGIASATRLHCIDAGDGNDGSPGLDSWDVPPAWRLAAVDAAGSRPDGTAAMALKRNGEFIDSINLPDGSVDNVRVDLPPGFVASPGVLPQCTAQQFSVRPVQCPSQTQVGLIEIGVQAEFGGMKHGLYPVYNLEPRPGYAAELGIPEVAGYVSTRIVGGARTASDYGAFGGVAQLPAALPLLQQTITLWAVPWEAEHDKWRLQTGEDHAGEGLLPFSGLAAVDQAGYSPAWGPIQPFVANVTECAPSAPVTRAVFDVFQRPGSFTPWGEPDLADADWKVAESPAPAVTGCEKLPFSPTVALDPVRQGGAANQATDSPTGLDVELRVPQNDDLPFNAPVEGAPQAEVDQYVADAAAYWRSDAGLATSHLKDTVITLPEGLTLNAAAADGQASCTTAQIGLRGTNFPAPAPIRFDNTVPTCPDASKVATVQVDTPLLPDKDDPTGVIYLAAQGDNPFDSDFAIYIVVRSPERDVIAKLAGKVEPDPTTGRLTTTFADNPQLPVEGFDVQFKAGPRAPLATPVTCGTHTNVSTLTPWSAAHGAGGLADTVSDAFSIASSPAGGCPSTPEQRPLNVGFSAGSTQLVGGSHSPFTVRLTRPDGNQELDRIEVTAPEGLVAKLAGVPYCPEASIAQAIARTASGDGALERTNPSCPAVSQVGTTTVAAGAGFSPIFVSGKVYLAGPYKGAPISLAVIVPAVAGPFDLGVQVVRTALNVNPRTAQVTAVSDEIPKILRGVPLRLRDIRVDIDRPGFTLNPTDCAAQLVNAKVFGASGAVSEVSNRFQVAECARLGFKPKLKLTLIGGDKRAAYQGLKAVLTTRPGDANIAKASVTLPKAAFLAQEHINTVCTRVQFAADQCPKGAIYGTATAVTPLLENPLTGNVYLRSSDNELPDLVPDLRGPAHQPIKVEVAGRTDSVNSGAMRNTFDVVPDAPVSKFTLQLFGGKKGLIVNSEYLCAKVQRATVKLTGQNGRTRNFRPVVRTGCTKKQIAKAKAKAKAKRDSNRRR